MSNLHSIHFIAAFFQSSDTLHRVLVVAPLHALLRPEGRLVYLAVRRRRADAAERYVLHAEGAGDENAQYISKKNERASCSPVHFFGNSGIMLF
mgnify:CR=1 FL=1